MLTSAKNGVHNIYLISKNKQRALTNTTTAYFSMSEDPSTGDIYATKLTDKGPWIYKISAQDFTKESAVLPQIDPLFADRLPPRNAGPIETRTYPVDDYSVGSTLWPKYWIPFIATSSNGALFQAVTSGFDPLKKHQYSLSLSWDTAIRRASFVGTYQNNVWSTPWFLQSLVSNTYFASVTDIQTTKSYLAGISPSLFNLSPHLVSSLAIKQSTVENATNSVRGLGPTASIAYSDISETGVQISPERGKTLTLSTTQYLKNGDDLNYGQYLLSGSIYANKWLPAHHAVMAKINTFYTPEKIASSLGASSSALSMTQDIVGPQFLMRGYVSGHFLGRNMINTNLEYRFPLREINRGNGTDPFYIRRLNGALIIDGVATEGLAYSMLQKSYQAVDFAQKFWSFGAELKLETTVGYVLPVQFVVYYYVPQNFDFGGNSSVGLTIQLAQSFF